MTPTRYFLSYAHADIDDVKRFNGVFLPQLATLPPNTNTNAGWTPTSSRARTGTRKIKAALKDCQFGVLLVSPNFLASDYITEVELTALLAKPMVVPVALHHPILFNGVMNLKGLAERQVYRDPGRP